MAWKQHYASSHHYGGYVGHIHAANPAPDPPPTDEPLTTPDLIEPVVAWRSWTLEQNGDLRSANGHVSWRPGPNEAVCDNDSLGVRHEHLAPQEHCQCGFYGYHVPLIDVGPPEILGLFKAWGTIVVHPTGIRAQWAEIALLVVPDDLKDVSPRIKRMREHYGVPIVSSVAEAKYRAEEHGQVVPEEMRPGAEEDGDESAMAVGRAMLGISANSGPAAKSMQQMARAAQRLGGTMSAASARKALGVATQPEQPKPPECKWWMRLVFAALAMWTTWAVLRLAFDVGDWWLLGGDLTAYAAALLLAPKLWSVGPRVKCYRREHGRGRWSLDRALLHRRDWHKDRMTHGLHRGDPCPYCGWKLR